MQPLLKPEDKLILALDFPDPQEAKKMVEILDGLVNFFKIGLVLYTAGGPGLVQWLLSKNKKVFLDLKFFDIPETVEKAVEQAAKMGVSFLTIHGNAQIIKNAVRGRGNSALKLLAVTVLTSLDAADLNDLGFPCSVEELVLYRAKKAIEYGCDGVVASGQEAGVLRSKLGARLLIVTPGIRPAERTNKNEPDLQKRTVTPKEAIAAGADYLVVGRPIIKAPDPRRAAAEIIREISQR
ncbi:MAG: orotidine-5'-phosphate decarboxylase [Bacillota bacterium]